MLAALAVAWLLLLGASGQKQFMGPPEIPVRRGAGMDFKIIAFLHGGEEVVRLGESGDFYHVRFGGDKTGYVLKRHLTVKPPEKPPDAAALAHLEAEAARLERENQELDNRRQAFEAALKDPIFLAAPAPAPQVEPEDLAEGLARAEKLIAEAAERKEILERELVAQRDFHTWFLIGAGVAALGMVLGFLMAKIWWRGAWGD